MKLRYLVIFLLFFSSLNAQNYRQGSYINNNNQQIVGFIDDKEWTNNPEFIMFKGLNDKQAIQVNIQNIKSFEIGQAIKYEKFKVNVDLSSDDTNKLSQKKDPNWSEEIALLKVLIDGKATLYNYENNGLTRYFFKLNGQGIEQLIFKRFYISTNQIGTNANFRNQLNIIFSDCSSIDIAQLEYVDYRAKSLTDLFENYNKCIGASQDRLYNVTSKTKFQISLGLGLNFTNAKFKHNQAEKLDPEFDGIISTRFGGDAEILLPFQDNRWSLFVGFYLNGDIDETIDIETSVPTTPSQSARFKLRHSELSIGARHYFPITDKFKGSLNLGILKASIKEFSLEYEFSNNEVDNNTTTALFLGAGLHYSRINLEARIHLDNETIIDNTTNYQDSKFNVVSFMATYTLF